MLLWGQFTVLAFVSGLVVALVVTRVFRLPPAELSGRINLWWGLVYIVTFLGAVVVGSLTVAWQAVDWRRQPGAAIIAVPLRTDDDLIMTHVGVTASLIPGSLVVHTDRERRIIYLHFIGVRSMADVEKLAPQRAALGGEDRARRGLACTARQLRDAASSGGGR
ncbi:Na+/H+ antiporter subunit E [Microbacterium elymi]|uniref:Na+/H+ antiporter subunit E n=1 Tax=Microbacterium elymi TaxID=2909587 RepID=A0ABY5NN36_9MICO|nr:Na+/H+ antiporter subunit E [Microbacterium elymi]UUT36621.1 Na+/H+ antiporter subunit E [Microbacterium elymi]